MAYPMPAGSIVQVVFRCLVSQQECLTVLHMKLMGPSTQPDGRASIVALLAKLSLPGGLFEAWRDCIAAGAINLTMRAQMIAPTRYLPVNNLTSFGNGGVAGDFTAVNLAAVITRQGEEANRHNTGNLHLPGVPVSFIVESNMQPAGNAAYAAFGALAIADETVAGGLGVFKHVIFNKASPGDSVDPVQFAIQQTGRTMHRRSVGLGS